MDGVRRVFEKCKILNYCICVTLTFELDIIYFTIFQINVKPCYLFWLQKGGQYLKERLLTPELSVLNYSIYSFQLSFFPNSFVLRTLSFVSSIFHHYAFYLKLTVWDNIRVVKCDELYIATNQTCGTVYRMS